MTWEIYRRDKKFFKKAKKNYWKVGIEPSIDDNTKNPRYTPGLSFSACQKKNVEFTDWTHIIYRPAMIA